MIHQPLIVKSVRGGEGEKEIEDLGNYSSVYVAIGPSLVSLPPYTVSVKAMFHSVRFFI